MKWPGRGNCARTGVFLFCNDVGRKIADATDFPYKLSMASLRPPGPRNGLLGLANYRHARAGYLAFSIELEKMYGDAVFYRLGPVPCYQFTHPEHAHEVLVKQWRSFQKTQRTRQVLGKWNGRGLFLNEGDAWASQRRMVQSAFHPRRVGEYARQFTEHACQLVERCQGRKVDLAEEFSRLTFATVSEALFGADVASLADAFRQHVEQLQTLGMQMFADLVVWPLWLPTRRNRQLLPSIRFLDELVMRIIAERRANGEDRGDLLSVLLAAIDEEGEGTTMTDRQARDEAVNLLLGGNETTATALTWTAYLLATHPDVQEAMHAELQTVLAGRRPAAEDAAELKLTAAVFKEAIRLYPPAYILTREAIETTEVAGYRIPKGANVILAPFIMHRDARWFDNPLQFCPQRFLQDDEQERQRRAYIPFGAGPRACIGMGFATLEAVMVLAMLLSRCRLFRDESAEPELEAQISLHPRGGLPLRVEPRG